MTLRIGALIAGVMIATGAMAAEAHASEARLVRVVLLRTDDRISLALEMTAEPQKAVLRALSATVLEVEAGPVVGPVREMQLEPSASVPVIRYVSLRQHNGANRALFVRARVMLRAPGRGNIRVVGRVVYVDFATSAPPRPAFPEAFMAALEPQPDAPPRVARVKPEPAPVAGGLQASGYQDAVGPFVARLTEIRPFLLSAASTPADAVLEAVGRTLTDVEGPLRAMNVPRASRPAHDLLTSAVETAARAVAPDFRGDRVAEAHRALALIDAAKLAGSW